MFLPHCLSNYESRLACIADLQVVHADGQDHSHQRLRGRLCVSLTACTHRSTRITTSVSSSEAKSFSPCYKRQFGCCCSFVSIMNNENWYVAHHLIYQIKIGVRSARKWTGRRFETVSRERKNPSLSSALRNSLSAMSPLRGSLSLSRRKFSRKISVTRIAVKHFADDLKFIEQVIHTDGQGHSHRRFRGRLYVPPSLPVELRRWSCVHCGLTGSPCRWTG